MLLDLDNFKHINDSLGHPVGDKLLCAVADRLGQILRMSDTLARLGGDEFAIVQTDLGGPDSTTVLAQKLIDALIEPFEIEQQQVHTSTSIGISLFPSDGLDAPLLIKNADVALYRAKAEGRNRMCIFKQWMTAEATARQDLESSLRWSLRKQDFVLYYQPLLDTASGRITGVEALVRWCPSKDRMLLPETFIPLCESTGLMQRVGDWILREACRQAAAWQQAGRPLTVMVNLSAAQVQHDDAIAMIAAVVKESGLDPHLLELEITESVFLDPTLASMTSAFRRLVDLGVGLSIDDFGTGYSSLAYLKHIPSQTIKIDRSFIRNINRSGEDEAIVVAVLTLGRELRKRVVAEGVEKLAHMALLHRLGCTEMQGFLIGRPQPPDDLEDFLRGWPAAWADLRQALGSLPAQ
jgi:diguanylate cyclase (GGDEF)-like protein